MKDNRRLTLADAFIHATGNDAGSRASIVTTCPSCKKDKLTINFAKGMFNCPACSSNHNVSFGGRDPVLLYGFLAYDIAPENLRSDAAGKSRLFRELNGKVGNSNFVPHEIIEIDESNKAPNHILDKAYRALYSKLVLYDHHWNTLSKRGLNPQSIERMGFKSVPTYEDGMRISEELNREGVTLEGVPGFFLDRNGLWQLKRNSAGFFIFIRNIYGQIVGAQIANDERDHAKYYQLSSTNLHRGAGSGTPVHFIGNFKGQETVYLTEGPLKANIAHLYTKKPFMAILGINAVNPLKELVNDLKKAGVRNIIMAIDMDYKINPNVANGRNQIIEMLRQSGFNVNDMFSWDNHNGIDDYLVSLAQGQGIYLNKDQFRVDFLNTVTNPAPNQAPYKGDEVVIG